MDGEGAVTGDANQQPDPALMEGGAAGADGAPAGGLVLGDDGLPIAPEENKAEEIIPEEILRDMENVWSVFDMN